MSINKKSYRIDLDAGDILYHMKVSALSGNYFSDVLLLEKKKKKTNRVFSQAKSHDLFYIWVTKLQAHRSFKRNEATQASSLLQTLPHCTAVGLAQRNGDLVINR